MGNEQRPIYIQLKRAMASVALGGVLTFSGCAVLFEDSVGNAKSLISKISLIQNQEQRIRALLEAATRRENEVCDEGCEYRIKLAKDVLGKLSDQKSIQILLESSGSIISGWSATEAIMLILERHYKEPEVRKQVYTILLSLYDSDRLHILDNNPELKNAIIAELKGGLNNADPQKKAIAVLLLDSILRWDDLPTGAMTAFIEVINSQDLKARKILSGSEKKRLGFRRLAMSDAAVDKNAVFLALGKMLDDKDPNAKIFALEAINTLSFMEWSFESNLEMSVFEKMRKIAENKSETTRKHAFIPLARRGNKISPYEVYSLLENTFQDKDAEVRSAAIYAYMFLNPISKEQILNSSIVLTKLLDDPNIEVRKSALFAIGHIASSKIVIIHLFWKETVLGSDLAPMKNNLPRILNYLNDPRLASPAIQALGSFSHESKVASALVESLRNPNKDLRREAVYSLTGSTTHIVPRFFELLPNPTYQDMDVYLPCKKAYMLAESLGLYPNGETVINFAYGILAIGEEMTKKLYQEQGVRYFARYHPGLLRQVGTNMKQGNSSRKPHLLMVSAESDYNGAFYTHWTKDLVKAGDYYRIAISEVRNDKGFFKAVGNFADRFGKIDTLIIAGHGSPRAVSFGPQVTDPGDGLSLDITDTKEIEGIRKCFVEKPTIILIACESAKGDGSIAETISSLLSGRVFAPVKETEFGEFVLDGNAKISNVTYTVQRKEFLNGKLVNIK